MWNKKGKERKTELEMRNSPGNYKLTWKLTSHHTHCRISGWFLSWRINLNIFSSFRFDKKGKRAKKKRIFFILVGVFGGEEALRVVGFGLEHKQTQNLGRFGVWGIHPHLSLNSSSPVLHLFPISLPTFTPFSFLSPKNLLPIALP